MNNSARVSISITARLQDKRWCWPLALFAITALAMALRWYYVSTAVVLNPVRGDAVQYYSYALNLVNHATFAKDTPGSTSITPDSYRDPGYPFFLALWMKGFGAGDAWYAAVLLTQSLLGALTVALATQLGKYWLSSPWAILAGFLMAIWPHSITINGYLLSETLFSFLCTLGMFLCITAYHKKSTVLAVLAGLVLGAAALTNAIFLPFGLLLAIFLIWRKYIGKGIFFAVVLGALLLPFCWAIRNSQIPPASDFDSSTDRALINFVQGAWPDYHSAWRASFSGNASEKEHSKFVSDGYEREFGELKRSPIKGGKAILERFGGHPWRYACWYLLEKPHLLWDWDIRIGQGDIYVYPTRHSPFDGNPCWIALYALCHAINLLLMLLALASLFFAWSKRSVLFASPSDHIDRGALAAVACLVVFVTTIYSVLQAEPRYSIAFRPFEMLLATTSLCGFSFMWKHRKVISPQSPEVRRPIG